MAYTNPLIERLHGDIAHSMQRRSQMAMLSDAVGGGGGTPAMQADSGGTPVGKVSGNVDTWISQAYKRLGLKLTPQLLNAERTLIQRESGGNPRAINNWDSNAKKGTPSKGLAQTIDSTFNSYKLPGGNIWNPVDNLIASLRYRQGRYGSIITPGMKSAMSGGSYRGY